MSAATQARTLDPTNVEVYGEIADAYLAQSRGEDAAIALAQGMFATSDELLWRRARPLLLENYAFDHLAASACSSMPGVNNVAYDSRLEVDDDGGRSTPRITAWQKYDFWIILVILYLVMFTAAVVEGKL